MELTRTTFFIASLVIAIAVGIIVDSIIFGILTFILAYVASVIYRSRIEEKNSPIEEDWAYDNPEEVTIESDFTEPVPAQTVTPEPIVVNKEPKDKI